MAHLDTETALHYLSRIGWRFYVISIWCVIQIKWINPTHSSYNCPIRYTHAVRTIYSSTELCTLFIKSLSPLLCYLFLHFHGYTTLNGLDSVQVTQNFDAEVFRNMCVCNTSLSCYFHGNMCGFCTT